MNRFKKAIFYVILPLVSASLLFAQNNTAPQNENTKKLAGTIADKAERFKVKNFSYIKKFSPKGDGDYLEVIFDVDNMTDGDVKLRFFTVGFHEKNAISRLARMWKGYPQWRDRDFDKEDLSIPFYDVIPDVGADLDKKEEEKRFKESDFLTLIHQVEQGPDKGVPFTVMGVVPSIEPAKRLVIDDKKEYIITQDRLKTTITVKLFSKYRSDQKFFNHFGLILVDDDSKQVVYRQFMKFKTRFKIR